MKRIILYLTFLLALSPFFLKAANYNLCLTNAPSGGGNGVLSVSLKNNTGATIRLSNFEIDVTANMAINITPGTGVDGYDGVSRYAANPNVNVSAGGTYTIFQLNYSGASNGTIITLSNYYIQLGIVCYSETVLTCTNNSAIFTISCPTVTLPIELLFFSAQKKNANDVLLNWATASEKQSNRFEVERSLGEPNAWTKIGSLKAAGNSIERIDYSMTDLNVSASGRAAYYRLKMIDDDETYKYSPVRSVFFDSKGTVQLYPNPAVQSTHLSLSGVDDRQPVSLVLMDAVGRIILKRNSLGGEHDIPLSNLAGGVYMLQAFAENGERLTSQRLMVY